MSYSPATPDKSTKAFSKEASKVAVPSIDKLTSSAKGKEASLHEPSPASTYGDTAAGDSVPATPLEAGDHGESVTSRLSVVTRVPASTFLSYSFRRTMIELFELEIKFLRCAPSLASGLATS